MYMRSKNQQKVKKNYKPRLSGPISLYNIHNADAY